MRKGILGVFALVGVLLFSNHGMATGFNFSDTVLNPTCYAKCLKDSQVDQCRVGDAVVCRNQCQRVPEIPVYYNGIEIQPEFEQNERGELILVLPSEVACTQCLEDNGRANQSSNMVCAVSTPDSGDNLCSSLLNVTTASATIFPISSEVLATALARNSLILAPCGDTEVDLPEPGETVFYSSYPKCQSTIERVFPPFMGGGNGLGCYETTSPVWTAQGCPAAARCCTVAGGCTVPDATAPIDNNVRGDGKY